MATALVVLLSITGCGSTTVQAGRGTGRRPGRDAPGGPAAQVTGFASVPLLSRPAGPVTVRVTGAGASRLALLLGHLRVVTRSQVSCNDPPGLMYRIVFGAGLIAKSKTVAESYRCAAGVTIMVAGRPGSWRRDSHCTLIRAVRRVLPARAKATRSLAIGCGS